MSLLIYLVHSILGLTAIFVLIAVVFINTSPQFGDSPNQTELERIKASENFKDGIFINQIKTSLDMPPGKMMEAVQEIWFSDVNDPTDPIPTEFSPFPEIEDSGFFMTWYGHSAVMIEMDGKRVFFDPMLGEYSSPIPYATKRYNYQQPIDLSLIPDLDVVVISHDHYDHLDLSSIKRLHERTKVFLVPLGVRAHLRRWGVPEEKIKEFDWGESMNIGSLSFYCETARHFSGRGLTDRSTTLWASWVMKGTNHTVYFSGYSGYGPHFKEIGKKYGPIDLAMMECGQYNLLWHDIHMLPKETVMGSADLQAKKILPIHWGAFNLAPHDWDESPQLASKYAEQSGVNLIWPVVGRRIDMKKDQPTKKWWQEIN